MTTPETSQESSESPSAPHAAPPIPQLMTFRTTDGTLRRWWSAAERKRWSWEDYLSRSTLSHVWRIFEVVMPPGYRPVTPTIEDKWQASGEAEGWVGRGGRVVSIGGVRVWRGLLTTPAYYTVSFPEPVVKYFGTQMSLERGGEQVDGVPDEVRVRFPVEVEVEAF
jgi:hypothetical protein